MRIHISAKTMLKAALIAATAFGVLSCSKEMRAPDLEIADQVGNDEGAGNDGEGGDVRTVLFRAHGASTKVQFGEEDGGFWPTLWTDNDASVKLSLNYSGAQTAAVTPSDDYASATFSATLGAAFSAALSAALSFSFLSDGFAHITHTAHRLNSSLS